MMLSVALCHITVQRCSAGTVCASCSGISYPGQCHHHTECASSEKCYNRRYSTDSGANFYELGCSSIQACAYSLGPIVGKREFGQHIKCLSCCNSTVCNQNHACGGAPVVNVTMGHICASCSGVAHPGDCNNHTRCYADEKCYVHRYETPSGTDVFDLGCIASQLCPLSRESETILGKRSEGQHSKCLECCNDGAICNKYHNCGTAQFQTSTMLSRTVTTVTPTSPVRTVTPTSLVTTGTPSPKVTTVTPISLVKTVTPSPKATKVTPTSPVKTVTPSPKVTIVPPSPTQAVTHAKHPADCSEVNIHQNGVYNICPDGVCSSTVPVYCHFDYDIGWTVIQRRFDGSVDFNRNWNSYKVGFGSPHSGEYWLGNDAIHHLTSRYRYEIKIVMTDWHYTTKHAYYGTFRISDEVDGYRFTVNGYVGSAGDSLSYVDGTEFLTYDKNNNHSMYRYSCTIRQGWWFHNCMIGGLKGHYYSSSVVPSNNEGVIWYSWSRLRYQKSLKATTMMIKQS